MHITIALPEKPVQDTRECEMEEISDSIYRETAPASYCQACINMAVCASRSCKWCSFQLTNIYLIFKVNEMRSFVTSICEDEFPGCTVKPIQMSEREILPEVGYTSV